MYVHKGYVPHLRSVTAIGYNKRNELCAYDDVAGSKHNLVKFDRDCNEIESTPFPIINDSNTGELLPWISADYILYYIDVNNNKTCYDDNSNKMYKLNDIITKFTHEHGGKLHMVDIFNNLCVFIKRPPVLSSSSPPPLSQDTIIVFYDTIVNKFIDASIVVSVGMHTTFDHIRHEILVSDVGNKQLIVYDTQVTILRSFKIPNFHLFDNSCDCVNGKLLMYTVDDNFDEEKVKINVYVFNTQTGESTYVDTSYRLDLQGVYINSYGDIAIHNQVDPLYYLLGSNEKVRYQSILTIYQNQPVN